MKKILLLTVLFVLFTGIVFAQEDNGFFEEVRGNPGLDWRADVKKNWISFEMGYAVFGLRYERRINSKMSLGLHGYV